MAGEGYSQNAPAVCVPPRNANAYRIRAEVERPNQEARPKAAGLRQPTPAGRGDWAKAGRKESPQNERHDYAALSIWSSRGRCVPVRAADPQELSLPLQVMGGNGT